jgi:ribosomal protein L11 methyltransferase
LIRLAVRCRRDDAEVALAELLELAPGGVEEIDEPEGADGIVEYAIYGAAGELPEIGALQAAAGEALVEVRSERVPNDWEERWKRFYHPVSIGGRLYVRPPWERPAERGGVAEIVINPGRAFGTGTHATTSMCLELLVASSRSGRLARLLRLRQRRSLCDLGCGSGVLAIAAAKLGFAPVLGIDSEPDAIGESDRNARLNYVDVELQRLDLRREPAPRRDVVTANLTATLLVEIAQGWATLGESPGTLIASGFLVDETETIRDSLSGAGLQVKRQLRNGDWAALLASTQ